MKIVYLILFITFLSGCRGTIPPAPIVQRCVIDLASGREICFNYKFDEMGGLSDETTEVRRAITDRSICFPVEEWLKLSTWRDEVIEWSEDIKR